MTLTAKQKQIADLVAKESLENKQVAERLKTTEGAVEQHLVKIYRRLGIHSREELKQLIDKVVVADARKRFVEVSL